MNHLTIHFHLKHYKECGLPFIEYMTLLLYENKDDWTIKELQTVLNMSERTIVRLRQKLLNQGFLSKSEDMGYSLSNKLYSN